MFNIQDLQIIKDSQYNAHFANIQGENKNKINSS